MKQSKSLGNSKLYRCLLGWLLILLFPLVLNGCGAFIVAGSAAGAYSYFAGIVTRTYSSGYKKVINGSQSVLIELEADLLEKFGDDLKTTLKGSRKDGTEISVAIEKVGTRLTRVSVRTGVFGVDKVTESELFHQNLEEVIKPRSRTITTLKSTPHKSKKYITDDEPITPETNKREKQAESTEDAPASITDRNTQGSVPIDVSPRLPLHSPIYIFYDDQETAYSGSYRKQLDALIRHLNDSTSTTVDIRGYTDSSGEASENVRLSLLRAEKIKAYLIENNIPADRIIARGFGAQNFLESNETERLRKMNRRVELHFNN